MQEHEDNVPEPTDEAEEVIDEIVADAAEVDSEEVTEDNSDTPASEEEVVESYEDEAAESVDAELSDEGDQPSIGEQVREAHAQEAEAAADVSSTDVEADEAPAEDAVEVEEPALYDDDSFPANLPAELREFVVLRPERKDGPWTWLEQPGLDPEVELVQRLAYELLVTGISWKRVMFGGTVPPTGERTTRIGKRGGISHGGDGRWFASPMDVVDAASAYRRANQLADWRKSRQRGAA